MKSIQFVTGKTLDLRNRFVLTTVYIREDYLELYNSKRKRGRPAKVVMKLMSKEIGGTQNGLQIH